MEGGASMIVIYIHLKSLTVYNFLTVINGVIIMPRINGGNYICFSNMRSIIRLLSYRKILTVARCVGTHACS